MAIGDGLSVDYIMREYADRLNVIYDNKTRGDYTMLGVLSTFLSEIVTPAELQTLKALREGRASVVSVPQSDYDSEPLPDWELELLESGHTYTQDCN